ncbi:MAG: P-loop NTPase [Chloroflexota bacterium]|nr:P-loop NTPase [Chloroflexota bacterium]
MEEDLKAKIEGVLDEVIILEPKRSLAQFNMVRDVEVADGHVKIGLALTALNSSAQESVEERVRSRVGELSGVKDVEIELVEAPPKDLNEFKHIVAVMSGKGGVGKSLVAGLLGISLARQGHEVGILDADITGPSIPRMFGVKSRPMGSDTGILPVETRSGIEIMSINLLLPQEDDAVIWRGPLLAKAIMQFWEDVLWGKLDYLIVDVPPGTADIPLTVMQSLPLTGVVIVSTPQDLAGMVVRKAVHMAENLNVRVLGVVENMSYLLIPETGKKLELFGKSKGDEMAKEANAPLLARLPIDPELARLCDEGDVERYNSEEFIAFSQAFAQAVASQG